MRQQIISVIALLCLCSTSQATLPSDCEQVILGIAQGSAQSHITISLLERNTQGQWERKLGPYAARIGRNGLIWGRGLHQLHEGTPLKREGDGCSPAGIFDIGGLWLTTKTPVRHDNDIPVVRVGPRDLWITDPAYDARYYNSHLRLNRDPQTPLERREQMRQNDYPHSIKMLICHNYAMKGKRAVPGGGSSIFFHIWRNDGRSATAGCTSMREDILRAFISRLDPDRHPVYVLLSKQDYIKYRRAWRLP